METKLTQFRLKNKKVVITGAAKGLGKEFANSFAEHGSNIFLLDNDKEGILNIANNLKKINDEVFCDYVDVGKSKSCKHVSKIISKKFGSVDVLINNAALYGGLEKVPFEDIKEEDWDKVMNVNLKGVWQMSKYISPLMVDKTGGSIINISSATVFSGSPNWMHYVASKGAVIAMSRVMARELGSKKVRVNVIAPGLTLTQSSKNLFDDAENYGISKSSLLRNAKPKDIAGIALFLASDLSKFVTGQTIIVDGGKQFI